MAAGSGSCRSVVKIDGLMFVHGGISPAVAPIGLRGDQRAGSSRPHLGSSRRRVAAPLASLTARVDGPLWYRGLAQEPDAFAPQVDDILAKAAARAIVVGHTVATTGRITTRFGGRVIQIDTGMQPAYAQGGRASALEIARGEATAIYVDRRDPVALPKRACRAGAAAAVIARRTGPTNRQRRHARAGARHRQAGSARGREDRRGAARKTRSKSSSRRCSRRRRAIR